MESQDSYGTPIALADCEGLLELLEQPPPPDINNDDVDGSTDFRPSQVPVSSALSADDITDYASPAIKRELMRDACQVNSEVALTLVKKYQSTAVLEGWCYLADLSPSKTDGYAQVSGGGGQQIRGATGASGVGQ